MGQRQAKSERVAPPTPADVSLFEENGVLIPRSQDGLSLYRYDLDTRGESHCTGTCGRNWPPLLASAGATPAVGEWKTIQRGQAHQWAFRGSPVYTYSQDKPGQTKGDGVGGVWHLISI